jgi:hypothetical protein
MSNWSAVRRTDSALFRTRLNFIAGLNHLCDDDFENNPDLQFSGKDFGFEGLVAIKNQGAAKEALRLIIEQGEGPSRGGQYSSDNHFSIFSALVRAWETSPWELYDVKKNPNTRDYKGLGNPQDFAYKVGCPFYCLFS